MKTPKLRLGIPLTAATIVYLLFSLFGCLLYILMPPFLCSIGARIHAYLLISAAMEAQASVGRIVIMVIAHLYVLAMLAMGIYAMVKGRVKPFFLMVALEIVLTFIFLAVQSDNIFEHTSGIVVNIAYCVWLFRRSVQRKPVRTRKTSK